MATTPPIACATVRLMAMLGGRTTEQLCNDFAATGAMDVTDRAVPKVRGWLMDELEARDGDAFERWVLSDVELPHLFYGYPEPTPTV